MLLHFDVNTINKLYRIHNCSRQEIDRIQRVIKTVFTTLCDLKLAIDGTIVMSQGLRESLDAMYDARIPQQWLKVKKYIKFNNYINNTYFVLISLIFVSRCHGNLQH